MGTTIRREPNLTALPKKVKPRYENVLNFKGLHITDNPFTADEASASDMLNVYVDDNNALTVRPRLEKTAGIFNINPNSVKLIKVFSLKAGRLYVLKNKTTNVVSLYIVKNTSGNPYFNIANSSSTSFSENMSILEFGDIINRYGQGDYIRIYDDNGQKEIRKTYINTNEYYTAWDVNYYIPTVKIRADMLTNDGVENEQYNAITNKYKVSYATPMVFTQTNFESFIGKDITLTSTTKSTTVQKKEDVFFNFDVMKKQVISFDTSSIGDIVVYTDNVNKCYISTDYGKTFNILECNIGTDENALFEHIKADHIFLSGDGTVIYTVYNGILKKYVNRVLIPAELDLSMFEVSSETYSVDFVNFDALSDVDYSGDTFVTIAKNNNYPYVIFISYDTNTTQFSDITIKECHGSGQTASSYIDTNHLVLNPSGRFCAINYEYYDTLLDDYSYGLFVVDKLGSNAGTPIASTNMYNERPVWVTDYSLTFIQHGVTDNIITYSFNKDNTASTTYTSNSVTITLSSGQNYTGVVIGNAFYYDKCYKIVDGKVTSTVLSNTSSYLTSGDAWVHLTSSNNGVIYYGQLDNVLYSNNAYMEDKDWFTVTYTDYSNNIFSNISKQTNVMFYRNAVWLYGYRNLLCFSGMDDKNQQDYTYFPISHCGRLGVDTTPSNEKTDITGLSVINDTSLAAYKRDKVFLIAPQIVDGVSAFTSVECKAVQGNVSIGQTINSPLTGIPIQINKDGVFALVNLANVYTADKVATLISEKINDKFLKENIENALLVAQKYWVIIMIPGDITHVYVYDDRTSEWFYWELPINVSATYKIDDDLFVVDAFGYVYKLNPKEKVIAINTDDAVTLYYDDVYVEGADNCFDAYGVQGKNIVWYWTSQILPLNSVSYAKQLNKTTFIVADSDVTDGYAFNFSIKGWRKKRTLVKSSDLDGTVYSVQATTKRTNVNRAHFIQLTVTNAMLENHQLMLSKTLKTDIDTNDQKVRLIGVSFKFKYLEV